MTTGARGAFELHIGFPSTQSDVAKNVGGCSPCRWKLTSILPPHNLRPKRFATHDVPSGAGIIATVAFDRLDAVVEVVFACADKFASLPWVRIEVEQILIADPADPDAPSLSTADTALLLALRESMRGRLLDAPPFESHFSVFDKTPTPDFSLDLVVELVRKIDLPADQALQVKGVNKVILTSFYDTQREALVQTANTARALERELAATAPNLSLKVVSERVLFCASP